MSKWTDWQRRQRKGPALNSLTRNPASPTLYLVAEQLWLPPSPQPKKWPGLIWASTTTDRFLKSSNPGLPTSRLLKLYANLSQPDASLLTQLRTGHAGLIHHLYCIGASNSPNCSGCNVMMDTSLDPEQVPAGIPMGIPAGI
ncbi:hypothetical protein BT96DRAFT_845027 [Gymnopus androsaceus JB14]|uniref:Uncharacterized protein n=1 Tax=Gymnopus androsaceus JB14 TaxID=1447944 RepID=A0A6A4GBM3_9AGAR|nr:hypothetical protein BT96DRAFT_845027 [Gymnopus androsaceus JB14]